MPAELFSTECFECDLSPKCIRCGYSVYSDGYVWNNKTYGRRSHEAWNFYYKDDLMPQKDFVVHHADKNTLNDSEDNLKKLTRKEHNRLHWNNLSDEEYKKRCNKISISLKGNQRAKGSRCSEERKVKQRQFMEGKQYALGCKHSEEANKKKSKAMTGNQHSKGFKHSEETKEKLRKRVKKYWADVKSGKRPRRKDKL